MSILIQSKQITKLLRANFYNSGYPYPAAATSNVTVALTSAASTAGDGNIAVPVQIAATGVEGFVVAKGSNKVSIFGAGITAVVLTGDTDGTTGVVVNIASTTTVVLGMVLAAALNGIPAGSVVTAKTATTVTFDTVSTVAATAASFTVQTLPGEQRIADSAGNEVYGRLTQAAGVYSLGLFSLVSGIETSFVPANPITLDFVVTYQYTFEHLPSDSLVGGSIRHIGDDPASTAARIKDELLTVTALNTISALTTAYLVNGFIKLSVNGQEMDRFGGATAAFTCTGTTVTWSATNAGYSLVPGDRVVAKYEY